MTREERKALKKLTDQINNIRYQIEAMRADMIGRYETDEDDDEELSGEIAHMQETLDHLFIATDALEMIV